MPNIFRIAGFVFWCGLLVSHISPAVAANSTRLPRNAGLVITATAFSNDDNQVLIATRTGSLELWDIVTGKRLREFQDNPGPITVISFSSDGSWIFAASDKDKLSLWPTATGKRVALPGFSKAGVRMAQLSGNGSLLVFVDDEQVIHAVDTVQQRLLWKSGKPWPRPITGLHLSPDGQRLLVVDSGGQPALYDFPNRVLVCSGGHFSGLLPFSAAATFSGDSQQLAVADGDFNIVIFNSKTCDRIATLHGHRNTVSALAFSADGQRLVSAGREAVLKVWEPADGKTLQSLPTLLAETTNVRFSPDGQIVSAWLVADGTVWNFLQRWNVSSGSTVNVNLPILDSGLVAEKMQPRAAETDHASMPKMETVTSPEGGFSVALPQDWMRGGARYSESGVEATRPGMNNFPARMTFARVDASKETLDTYQSADTFIRIFSRSVLFGWSEIGSEFSEVSNITVAGRPAKSFERRVYEYVALAPRTADNGARTFDPKGERMGKRVLTYHRYVVIPFTGGFYRIEYAAEDSVDSRRHLATFEAALASFKIAGTP